MVENRYNGLRQMEYGPVITVLEYFVLAATYVENCPAPPKHTSNDQYGSSLLHDFAKQGLIVIRSDEEWYRQDTKSKKPQSVNAKFLTVRQ